MPNEQSRQVWTTSSGETWVRHHRIYDRMLEGVLAALLEALAIEDGQRILDVGCGTGTLTGAVAGQGADAVGVDLSPTMIDGARQRWPHLDFFVADAQTDDLRGPYDGIVSRFGVMFFDDPVAAFVNLRGAAVEGGPLTFVCWRGLDVNPVFAVGAAALNAALPAPPPPPDPLAPGPLAFADDARLRGVLIDAGWSAIDIEPVDTIARFGLDGSDGLDERMVQLLAGEVGRRFLEQVPEADRAPAIAAARAELAEHVVDSELQLAAAAWLVRARC